jgi:hypothetical protein
MTLPSDCLAHCVDRLIAASRAFASSGWRAAKSRSMVKAVEGGGVDDRGGIRHLPEDGSAKGHPGGNRIHRAGAQGRFHVHGLHGDRDDVGHAQVAGAQGLVQGEMGAGAGRIGNAQPL